MENKNVEVKKSTGEVVRKRRVIPGQTFKDPKTDTIKVYKEISEVVKTGEGKSDFKIKKKLVVAEEYNRADYINSFSHDVGIQNILKKVALSGKDLASVVESGAFKSKQEGVVDISKMPDNLADAFRAVEKGVAAFDQPPEDLRKKMSFDAFAKSVNMKDIQAYIEAEVQKRLPKEVKEEKGKGE